MIKKIFIFFFFLISYSLFAQEQDSLVDQSKIYFDVKKSSFKVLFDSCFFYSEQNPRLSIFFGLEALKKMDDNIDVNQKGLLLANIGSCYLDIGNYPKAIQYYFEELKLYHDNNGEFNNHVIAASINIGEAYRAAADFNSATEHLNNALQLISISGKKANLPVALNRLSAVYYEIGTSNKDTNSIFKAISLADSSINFARAKTDTGLIANNLNILGASHTYLGNYQKAIQYYSEAESFYPRGDVSRSNLLNNIANNYLLLNDFDKAIKFATESYNLSKPIGILAYIREATGILNKAYSKKGNYEKAFLFLDEYNSVSYHLYNDETRNKLMLAEKKYEIDKNNRILEEEKIIKFITISGIFILAVFGITFFYIRQRYYKKKNLILTDLNNTKNRFISILSHDLRSPLTGINGLLEILCKDFDSFSDEEKKQFLSGIYDSTKNLTSLIENLLQWSKLQQGRYELIPNNIYISQLVNNIIDLYKLSIATKKIQIHTDINPEIKVKADENFLSLILRNLIDNAIKYSNEGGSISIIAKNVNRFIEISVSDTGIGIDSETLSKLFKIDENIRSKGTKNEAGSGLGLLLVKEMVEKSGGTISAKSTPDVGSTFTFTIPAVQ